MNKYSFKAQYIVDVNDRELHFYTHMSGGGVTTTLWKYNLSQKKLYECFEINDKIEIWKYHNNGYCKLEYVGISFGRTTYIMGFDSDGEIHFKYGLGANSGEPIYDEVGNIYVSVNNAWIFCLNNRGELLWKWKPICNDCGRNNGIKAYWIVNEKLYVIAMGQEFVVALDGNLIKKCLIADYNEGTQYIVGNGLFFLKSANAKKILCYNFDAERIWECCVETEEMIYDIVTIKKNIICLKAKKIIDNTSILYVIDQNGQKKWTVMKKWTCLFGQMDGNIVLNSGKSISIYNSEGMEMVQYNSKDYILWGNLIGENLLIIEERGSSTFVVHLGYGSQEEVCLANAKEKKEIETTSAKNTFLWQRELFEYLMLNIEIWKMYYNKEICDIELSYKLFGNIHMQMMLEENVWISGMASSIPVQRRLEKDRDLFKECDCRDGIVWQELCASCSEEEIEIVVRNVCSLLRDKFCKY